MRLFLASAFLLLSSVEAGVNVAPFYVGVSLQKGDNQKDVHPGQEKNQEIRFEARILTPPIRVSPSPTPATDLSKAPVLPQDDLRGGATGATPRPTPQPRKRIAVAQRQTTEDLISADTGGVPAEPAVRLFLERFLARFGTALKSEFSKEGYDLGSSTGGQIEIEFSTKDGTVSLGDISGPSSHLEDLMRESVRKMGAIDLGLPELSDKFGPFLQLEIRVRL